jgi:predicted MFS family arabinose efflux permease
MNTPALRQGRPWTLTRRLILAALLLLTASIAVTSHAALDAFERQVKPEIGREATAIGGSIVAPIERAVALGVPFAELGGVAEYLREVLERRPGVAYLVLADPSGGLLFGEGPGLKAFAGTGQPQASSIREAPGAAVPAAYDTALPVRDANGQLVGWLHVGMSREGLDVAVRDARWDVLIVLLVSILLAVEILRFAIDRSVSAPAALMEALIGRLSSGTFARASTESAKDEAGRLASAANILVRRLSDRWDRLTWLGGEVSAISAAAEARTTAILARLRSAFTFRADKVTAGDGLATGAGARMTLFLFAMAEQFSTSFIPLFGQQLGRQSASGLGPDLLAAVPIATFVAAVALATPFGGRLVSRHGARQAILLGSVPVALGFLGCAFATTIQEFALARMLCGAGYAVVTIACQAELARAAAAGRVARSLGGFTGAVMTGAVCGTAIGAVLADRLGFSVTFLLSAVLVVVVQLVAARCITAEPQARPSSSAGLLAEAGQAARSLPFSAMVVLVAIPAKLVLGGFVFYAAPIALRDLGFSQPAIGRSVMLYGLCMLPAIALGAWLSDRARVGGILMLLAGLMTGAALVLPMGFDMGVALPVAVGLVGILQGLASAPMLALAPALALGPDGPSVPMLLSFLRLGERLGSVIGPMLAAYVMTVGGTGSVMLLLGAISAIAALGYGAILLAGGRSRGREGRAVP